MLTRAQQRLYQFVKAFTQESGYAPSIQDACDALGVRSRGSLHKHVQALVEAGLIEPMQGRPGIRLAAQPSENQLPFFGYIAAGKPIEAISDTETMEIPGILHSQKSSYVLQVKGDSMIEEGILDGDWVVVEHCDQAPRGSLVVALIDGAEATLKRIHYSGRKIILRPANMAMQPMEFEPGRVQVQGIVTGLLRNYR